MNSRGRGSNIDEGVDGFVGMRGGLGGGFSKLLDDEYPRSDSTATGPSETGTEAAEFAVEELEHCRKLRGWVKA